MRRRFSSQRIRAGGIVVKTTCRKSSGQNLSNGVTSGDCAAQRYRAVFSRKMDGNERMRAARQTTLREQVTVSGIGVHSGLPVNLTLNPADADTGIVFSRTDEEGREREVRADFRAVTATELATVLGDESGVLCSTAEH